MIRYSPREWCSALRHVETLGLSNFRLAAFVAIATSVCTALLIFVDNSVLDHHIVTLDLDVSPYTTLTGVLGFVLSFRTCQAYDRFRQGVAAAYELTGGIHMAASNLLAFAHHGNSNAEEILAFKHITGRLLSLLSAMMLTQLEGKDTLNTELDYNILDLASLHMPNIRGLAKEEKKAETVTQWIKMLIIENINTGTLSVPAPILTRVFQELDISMGRFHAAEMYSQVPFPFPYVAILDVIMALHTLVTPLAMMNLFNSDSFLPVPVVAMIVFVLWSLHLIPGELENPFDGDKNDVDLAELQDNLNEKLKAIIKIQPVDVPFLVVSAHAASARISKSRIRSSRKMSRGSTRGSRRVKKHLGRTRQGSIFSAASSVCVENTELFPPDSVAIARQVQAQVIDLDQNSNPSSDLRTVTVIEDEDDVGQSCRPALHTFEVLRCATSSEGEIEVGRASTIRAPTTKCDAFQK